jgi:hypothetical protein
MTGPSRKYLLSAYVIPAILTLAFQIWVRSLVCVSLAGCGLSFAKAVVWSIIWPLSWVVFLIPYIRLYL